MTIVLEWKIDNFSCWCEAVHGKCLLSPDIFFKTFIAENAELFPRGFSGQDDQMELRLCGVPRDVDGDLSYIGFDGSLICSQQVTFTQRGESVLGPKFEEVVNKRRLADPKDEITVRLCIPSELDTEQRICTTIGVSEVTLKIDPKFIENFEPNKQECIFYIRCSSVANHGLQLNVVRKDKKNQLILQPLNKMEIAVLVKIDMSILTRDNVLIGNEEIKHVFVDQKEWTFSESEEIIGTSLILRMKITNGGIIQGYNYRSYRKELTIIPNNLCFSEQKSLASPSSSNQSDDSVTVLTQELMYLFQDQDYSDFQLKCDSITFPVHRAILSARSPVFKTMLSTNMSETVSNQVDIEDLDPSTVSRFLTFLYTGAVGEEDLQGERALNLYYAADKYQVPSLKRECANFLCANVTNSNVCDVLSVADKHLDADLTAASHNYILDNFNDVLESKEWERFMEKEPLLAVKTLTLFTQKKYVKRA